MRGSPQQPRATRDAPCLTVLFDGSCPLCRRDIAFYRRRRGAEHLQWVDVSREETGLAVAGIRRAAAMERFHVVQSNGRAVSGAAAFALLWRSLPGFARAGRIASVPVVIHALELGYVVFLRLRPLLARAVRRRRAPPSGARTSR